MSILTQKVEKRLGSFFFILKFSVALYLDLYKTQKAHKKTREESLQNFGEILIVILNFLDVAQKRL